MTHTFQATRWLTLSSCFAVLVGCGSGDAPWPPTGSREPMEEPAQTAPAEQFATVAPSLPTPDSAETPMLQFTPPATTDEPPPRAPAPKGVTMGLVPSQSTNLLAPSLLRQTVATGLKAPTDLAFTRDGVLFYTERAHGLYAQRPGHAAVAVFTPGDVATGGASGMLAVAVDPEFSRNRFVYVFSRASAEGIETSRVSRLAMNDSHTKVLDRSDIVVVASTTAPESKRGSEPNLGGAMRFGPDGYLYVGLGDGRRAATPQSPQMLEGKILRVDRNGQAAPGNRAPAGFDGRIFAYGVRDPVALALHPNTEVLLVAQRRGGKPDDIGVAKAGTNGGWDPRCMPVAKGYCEREEDQAPAAGLTIVWRGDKAGDGLAALERLRDPIWRDWRNAFAVAFDQAQRLDLVKVDASGHAIQTTSALGKLGVGFKAVAQGPDGLYVVTSGKAGGEEIWRLIVQMSSDIRN